MSLQDAAHVVSYLEARKTILRDPSLTPFGQGQMLYALEEARQVADQPSHLTPRDLVVGAIQAGLGYGVGTLAAKFLGAGPQTTANLQSGGFGLGSLLGMGLVKKAAVFGGLPPDTSGAPINSATGQAQALPEVPAITAPAPVAPVAFQPRVPAPAPKPLYTESQGTAPNPYGQTGFSESSAEGRPRAPSINYGHFGTTTRRVDIPKAPAPLPVDNQDMTGGELQPLDDDASKMAAAQPNRGFTYSLNGGPQQTFQTQKSQLGSQASQTAQQSVMAKTTPQQFSPMQAALKSRPGGPLAPQGGLSARTTPAIPAPMTTTPAQVEAPKLPTASSVAPSMTPKPTVPSTAMPGSTATMKTLPASDAPPAVGTTPGPSAPPATAPLSKPTGPTDMGNTKISQALEEDRRYAFRLGFIKRAVALGLLEEAKVAIQLLPVPTLPLTPETFAAPIRGTMNAFSTAARGAGSLLGHLDSMDSTDKSVMRMEAEASELRRQEEALKARRANRIVGALLARRKNPPPSNLEAADPVVATQSA